MVRLSRPLDQLKSHYTVVVVGSGYGGAIAASRLARAGQDVCVLERGKELHPGEYPDTGIKALREMQARTRIGHFGSRTAMFDFHLGQDISVLVGCGLGGTSLINANVALQTKDWVLDDKRWPRVLRMGGLPVLHPYYERAMHWLGSNSYPDDWPALPKLAALQRSAEALGVNVERPRINVTFRDGPNVAGVSQHACTLCGDCVSGCNYGAKNTVLMNYLPDAYRHDAQIFTEVAVRSVHPREDGTWLVAFDPQGRGRERFDGPTQFVSADVVVLAAGSLGSTEILLRSAAAGLSLSSKLGHRFTGNGDVFAVAYDADTKVRGIGLGRRIPANDRAVGPCIVGMIDMTELPKPDMGLLIEDGSPPGAMGSMLPLSLWAAAAGFGTEGRRASYLLRRLREAAAIPLGPYRGPIDRTLTYLVMSTDDDHGQLALEDGGVRVDWPGVGDRPVFRRNNEKLERAAHGLNATYVPNPMWTKLFGQQLLTVHPLGGCVMGNGAETGVVNHKSQVFAGPTGTKVHRGLYVMDGAIVPRPLAVNPLLTISALAERAVELLAADRKWRIDLEDAAEPFLAPANPPRLPGLRFTEKMGGFFSTRIKHGFDQGFEQGREEGSSIEFVLTVEYDNLDAVLRDHSHEGRLTGTVVAPELSQHRLTVESGTFRLFVKDPTHVETSHMRYEMELRTEDGRRFHLSGYKLLRERSGLYAWHDTTTLFVTVRDQQGATVGVGIMRIAVSDFLRQLRTMQVVNEPDADKRRDYLVAFLRMFAGSVFHMYGGPLDEPSRFPKVPDQPTHHPIQRPKPHDPEVRWFGTDKRWHEGQPGPGDPARLRLTRLKGGKKGPVVLAGGFAMSTHSFVLDTIGTNMAEYLVDRKYDVWLFDYRASKDLPSAKSQFTLDDIAREDWPTAVAEILRVTEQPDLQAYGHCVASATLLMAMLWGMEGVRSAVCSQFTTHPMGSLLSRIKAYLRVGPLMGRLGIHVVGPNTKLNVPDVLLDLSLVALPMATEEKCGLALCRWINAIYGCTHRHAQLDQATHDAMVGMFGVGNVSALKHLAVMTRKAKTVDHHGKNVYLTHPERLRLPILFLHGSRNYIFMPRGSAKTVAWLRRANGPGLYDRRVLKGYAHLDTLIGRNAARDVFPHIVDFFNRTNPRPPPP